MPYSAGTRPSCTDQPAIRPTTNAAMKAHLSGAEVPKAFSSPQGLCDGRSDTCGIAPADRRILCAARDHPPDA